MAQVVPTMRRGKGGEAYNSREGWSLAAFGGVFEVLPFGFWFCFCLDLDK